MSKKTANHRFRHLSKAVLTLSLFWIWSSAAAYAEPVRSLLIDSVKYKDTLVESSMEIIHRPLRVGAFGAVGFNYFQTNGPLPSAMASCFSFGSGSAISPNFGLQADIPLWGDISDWTLVPRLAFETYNARLVDTEVQYARNPTSEAITQIHFLHVLTPIAHALTFQPLFAYHPLSFLDILIGPSLSINLTQNFQDSTEAVEPGITINGNRQVLAESGAIPNRHLFAAGLFGSIGVEVPLSRKLRAIPEAAFAWPISGVSSHFNVQSFRAGIGFQYDLTTRKDTVPIYNKVSVPDYGTPQVAIPPPPPPLPKKLSAEIEAVALDEAGNESRVLTISVEEVRSRNAFPILNYIFFDENSSKLPSRYVQYQSREDALHAFKGSDERHDVRLLNLYRETLNILGDRLRKNPKANIALVGCTSNFGSEEGNLDLAKARADAVKSYLTTIWDIQPERIRTQGRMLPERPSPSTVQEGREENRRVEIHTSDTALFDPVTVVNTERVATPPRLKVIPHIDDPNRNGIRHLRTAITSGSGTELVSAESGPEGGKNSKNWALNEEILSQLSDSLYLTLNVEDSAGNRATATSAIPLRISRISSEKQERLERYSLILFGFDESSVTGRNNRILNRLASSLPELNPEQINIVGYTDELGDQQHNDQLSLDRAMAAKRQIEAILRGTNLSKLPRILPEGRGSRERLYDNSLPEGRFFSRTVNITIERAK